MRILEYAKALSANSEIVWWLEHTAKAALKKEQTNESELEHIIDWFVSGAAPQRLQKMSIDAAKVKAYQWMKANIKKGYQIKETNEDIKEFMDFKEGFKFVELLTKNAFQREGTIMSHCLGGWSPQNDLKIYSLRDSANNPHCTIEVRGDKDINQIKGKGNGNIHPKYINYVLEFLEKIGMKIRPSEMQNLGFYYIDKYHLDFIRSRGLENEMVCIRDEYYAY